MTSASQNRFAKLTSLKLLRRRIAANRSNICISEREAELLDEAISIMEEKEAQAARTAPQNGRKPSFLSFATILASAGAFGLSAIGFWQTSLMPALVAGTIGLIVGIAAVKLDPGD